MKNIFNIAKFTLKENISKNSFNGSVMIGLILLFIMFCLNNFLLENIVNTEEIGFRIIEIVLLITMLSSFGFEIIKERRTNEIYLLFSKSVKRSEYLLGKTLGFFMLIMLSMVILGLANTAILIWDYNGFDIRYLLSLVIIFYKLIILTSLGILFSVVFEGVLIGFCSMISLYIMGYFTLILKESCVGVNIGMKYLLESIYYIIPNFSILDYKGYGEMVDNGLGVESFYTGVYIVIVLIISLIVFKRKKT